MIRPSVVGLWLQCYCEDFQYQLSTCFENGTLLLDSVGRLAGWLDTPGYGSHHSTGLTFCACHGAGTSICVSHLPEGPLSAAEAQFCRASSLRSTGISPDTSFPMEFLESWPSLFNLYKSRIPWFAPQMTTKCMCSLYSWHFYCPSFLGTLVPVWILL